MFVSTEPCANEFWHALRYYTSDMGVYYSYGMRN
jgi:hypothetical protein